MTPFYFGTSDQPLFGIYHSPASGQDRECGVVLCHSMGREYVLGHRTFRQLAVQLTRAGFHVLRFDYHGCGDSSGDSDEGRLDQWIDDVSAAIDETRDYGGLKNVSLIGLRLGASLSALIGARRTDLQSLVLWEPIVNGKKYVEELLDSHDDWLRRQPGPTDNSTDNSTGGNLEILGFVLTEAMRRDLEALDLLAIQQIASKRALIIEQSEQATSKQLGSTLEDLETQTDYRTIAAPRIWIKGEMNKSQVPVSVLQAIVDWMSEVCS